MKTYFVFMSHGMQTVWLSACFHEQRAGGNLAEELTFIGLVPLCSSTIFTLEYNFNASQIVSSLCLSHLSYPLYTIFRQGLTNLGGIVGIVLAMAVTGPLNDWGVVWIAKRNRGVYEPEFRLIFMLSMLFGVFGYVGWAVGNDHHMPWIGAVACITYVRLSPRLGIS